MKADTSWAAPQGARLARAIIAWQSHAEGIWGRAVILGEKPPWVQELWAQVADAALAGRDDSEGARLAFAKRIELEGRSDSWDTIGPFGHDVWRKVASDVRKASA